jgi:hypothetical protein
VEAGVSSDILDEKPMEYECLFRVTVRGANSMLSLMDKVAYLEYIPEAIWKKLIEFNVAKE